MHSKKVSTILIPLQAMLFKIPEKTASLIRYFLSLTCNIYQIF